MPPDDDRQRDRHAARLAPARRPIAVTREERSASLDTKKLLAELLAAVGWAVYRFANEDTDAV